jgi:hypothetical protein
MAFMQRHFRSGLGKRWWQWRALADRRDGREPSYVEPDEEPDDPPVGEPEPPIDTPEDPVTEEPEPGVDPDFVEATRIEIADSKQTVIRTEAEPNTWGNAYVGSPADAYDYWEVHIDASTPTNSTLAVGVTNNDLPLNGVPGDLAGTAAYWSTGKVRINAVDTTGFATFGRRDKIMIARDNDTGRIWFGKNGAWLGSTPAVAGSGHQATLTGDGPYYPFVSLYSSGARITFKFITSKFAYPPPTGFFPLGQTPAEAPGQFQPADWSVADDGTGGAVTITVTALPADAGELVTIEYQVDGGSWVSLGAAAVTDYPITGLTDDVEVDIAIRGVNAAGNGTASATKAVTPTTAVPEFSYQSSHSITTNLSSGITGTIAGVDFGAEAASRVIILGVETTDDVAGGGGSIPASITVGGVTATAYAPIGGTTAYAAIYVAEVPTGLTGSIVVTAPTTMISTTRINVWRAANLQSNAPHDTLVGSTTPGQTGAIDIPAGGFAVGVARSHNTNDIVWTGLDEETGAEATVETRRYSAASREFVSETLGHTAGATAASNTRARMSIASFR